MTLFLIQLAYFYLWLAVAVQRHSSRMSRSFIIRISSVHVQNSYGSSQILALSS